MSVTEQPKKVTGGAFGRFLAEQRPALTEECKGKPVTAVVKLASERFKALSEVERASYDEKYKQAVQQYEKDMESFLAAGGEKKAVVKKTKKTGESQDSTVKKQKDPDAPKKPVGGAYGIFSNEKRGEFTKAVEARGEKGFGPIAKMTSEAFKALSDTEKAAYEQKFASKLAEYKEAYAAYAEKVKADKASICEENPVANRSREPAGTPNSKRGRMTTKETPTKPPVAKRRRAEATGTATSPGFEADVVAAAEKEGLLNSLSNLARRPEIVALKCPPMELLKALKDNDGLVNKAKVALLNA